MTTINIFAFIEHCRVQRGLSANSLRAYRQDLDAFLRFQNIQGEDTDIGGKTILSYVTFLREQDELSSSTIRRRIVTLRSYFSWLKQRQEIDLSPFDGLPLELKTPRRLPRPIDRPTLTQLFRKWKRITNSSADPTFERTPADMDCKQVTGLIARLLISTGLRIGEITRVRICDISSSGACIRVRGKGDRERSVYVTNKPLLQDLDTYLEWRREHAGSNEYLFLNSRGKRLTEPAFRKRLRSISNEFSISPHLTPHQFRHSAATMLIEEGVDIRLIQRLLGHASIATTEIYTKVSDTSLISAIKSADTLSQVDS